VVGGANLRPLPPLAGQPVLAPYSEQLSVFDRVSTNPRRLYSSISASTRPDILISYVAVDVPSSAMTNSSYRYGRMATLETPDFHSSWVQGTVRAHPLTLPRPASLADATDIIARAERHASRGCEHVPGTDPSAPGRYYTTPPAECPPFCGAISRMGRQTRNRCGRGMKWGVSRLDRSAWPPPRLRPTRSMR
jgi:hypothetical protein